MDTIVIAALAMVAGGASVWAFMQYGLVRPLEGSVRALAASCDDMGWLMGQQRTQYREQVGVLEERVHSQDGDLEAMLVMDELDQQRIAYLRRTRDEARANTALALTFYGRAVERAEAAELELRRERIVSDGLEALLSGERAA